MYGTELGMMALGRSHAGLPDDLLNFHYDPVACALALASSGIRVEEMHLQPVLEHGVLRFHPDPDGRSTRVACDVEGERFREAWFTAVATAQRPPGDG